MKSSNPDDILKYPQANIGSCQHTVPELLFRPFETDEADTKRGRRVWVYKKKSTRIQTLPISRISTSKGFYDSGLASKGSLDGCITGLESDAGAILARIREKHSFPIMTKKVEKILALFVACQFYRTKKIRNSLDDLSKGKLKTKSGRILTEGKEWFQQDYPNQNPSEVHLKCIGKLSFDLAELLLTKIWYLYQPAHTEQFVTSDHPVLLQHVGSINDEKIMDEGNFYLPIAPDLCIGMCVPDMQVRNLPKQNFRGIRNQIFIGKALVDDIDILHLNTSQIRSSHQLVIARNRRTLENAISCSD